MVATDLELLTTALDKDPANHDLLFAIGELWEETEIPPEPLLDYLLDWGLDHQAENYREVLNYRSRPSGPRVRPLETEGGVCWNLWSDPTYPSEISKIYFNALSPTPDLTYARKVPFGSVREALLALIDCEPSTKLETA